MSTVVCQERKLLLVGELNLWENVSYLLLVHVDPWVA
jgi:hypothetical protein